MVIATAGRQGTFVTALATGWTGNTSEFSAHIAVTGPNPVLDLDANDSSGATGANYQATFTENGPAVSIADALDALLTDPDSPTLTGLTVTITNVADGAAETLSAAVGGTAIVANYAGGVLQLTGADTIANYQQVLRTVAYHNASDNPNTTARVITFVATDGTNASNAGIATVTVGRRERSAGRREQYGRNERRRRLHVPRRRLRVQRPGFRRQPERGAHRRALPARRRTTAARRRGRQLARHHPGGGDHRRQPCLHAGSERKRRRLRKLHLFGA